VFGSIEDPQMSITAHCHQELLSRTVAENSAITCSAFSTGHFAHNTVIEPSVKHDWVTFLRQNIQMMLTGQALNDVSKHRL